MATLREAVLREALRVQHNQAATGQRAHCVVNRLLLHRRERRSVDLGRNVVIEPDDKSAAQRLSLASSGGVDRGPAVCYG